MPGIHPMKSLTGKEANTTAIFVPTFSRYANFTCQMNVIGK